MLLIEKGIVLSLYSSLSSDVIIYTSQAFDHSFTCFIFWRSQSTLTILAICQNCLHFPQLFQACSTFLDLFLLYSNNVVEMKTAGSIRWPTFDLPVLIFLIQQSSKSHVQVTELPKLVIINYYCLNLSKNTYYVDVLTTIKSLKQIQNLFPKKIVWKVKCPDWWCLGYNTLKISHLLKNPYDTIFEIICKYPHIV